MNINPEIFKIVDYTAVGLLSTIVIELGMDFTPSELSSLVMKNKTDERQEVMNSFDMLVKENLLLLKNNRYYVNSDYMYN